MNGIEAIDKNFALGQEANDKNSLKYYPIPHGDFDLYGVYYCEKSKRFMRMPSDAAEQVNEGVKTLAPFTAGGRIRFSTDSSALELRVSYEYLRLMVHMPVFGQGAFTLLEEKESGRRLVKVLSPDFNDLQGFTAAVDLPSDKQMHSYILYFPLYNAVQSLTIGLDETACVKGGRKYRNEKPILYYGSSITQGGCASRADNAYQALIEKWNHIDFINLGFSGSARAEDAMVDYLTTVDCSLFVCDYDHNAPDAEYLQNTHFRLYERYRKIRPDVPILFLTKPDGFRDPQGEERAKIIQKTYLKARRQGDKNIYFLHGKNFYTLSEQENCSVDGCHPNDFGFYCMAQAIYRKMKQIDKRFE